MAVDLTALTAEVANNTSVTNSVVQLVTQTALNALVTTLQSNDTSIASAVTAHTPVASASAPAVKPAS